MTEVSDWKTKDLENTAIDDLTLSAPQGSYWQKMMGAIARKFDVVDAELAYLGGIAVGGTGSEWAWNPTPIQTVTLDNAWYDDVEDGPYGYDIILQEHFNSLLVDILQPSGVQVNTGFVVITPVIHGLSEDPNYRYTFLLSIENALEPNGSCAARIFIFPEHGIYKMYGSTRSAIAGHSGPIYTAYSKSWTFPSTYPVNDFPLFYIPGSYIEKINIIPSSNTLPAGTKINIYAPLLNNNV